MQHGGESSLQYLQQRYIFHRFRDFPLINCNRFPKDFKLLLTYSDLKDSKAIKRKFEFDGTDYMIVQLANFANPFVGQIMQPCEFFRPLAQTLLLPSSCQCTIHIAFK